MKLAFKILILVLLSPTLNSAQTATQEISVSGTVTQVSKGKLSIVDESNKTISLTIQDKDQGSIVVGGQRIRIPATIKVSGKLPIRLLRPGMHVKFNGAINRLGRFKSPLNSLRLVASDNETPEIKSDSRPTDKQFVQCTVVGRIEKLDESELSLSVAKSELASRGRLTVEFDPNATFVVADDDLSWVQVGDRVTRAEGLLISTGESLVRAIDIELNPEREQVAVSMHDELVQKYSHLSDAPAEPRSVRSAHFVLRTDVSDRNAQVLLDKLETMYELIASYYRAEPRQLIKCFVVRDLSQWDSEQLHPHGRAKIQEKAGSTISARRGNQVESIVFSCDNHSVVQHEAVHAFCYLTFGSTGPTWYAEGMAELGNYWRPGEIAVNIDPVVIGYLTNAEPKRLLDIVAEGQITGDSWQAYSWRWALCYLLATNPNYSDRFKKLGVNMMRGKGGSFESAYGDIASEISFEYDQFVQNFGNGYRADLCAWDWRKPRKISGKRRIKTKVEANKGWQAARVTVETNKSYRFKTSGKWQINSASNQVTADGDRSGNGQLIGAILKDGYELAEPFELGLEGSFEPAAEGALYLRCRDSWTELTDNEGTISVEFTATKK